MASVINLANVTNNPEEARVISQAVFENLFANPELNRIHDVRTGVEMDTYIPIFGQFGLLAKASTGCAISASGAIPVSQKQWTPKILEFRLAHCQFDVDQQFKLWKRSRIAANTWSEVDDEMMAFIVDRAIGAAKNEIIRIAWFGDTAAALIAGGGIITAGTTLTYFNMLNGIWKQIYAADTAGDITPVVISENSGASYAAQSTLDDDTALVAMRTMYETIDSRAFDYPDLTFQMTRSLYANWINLLEKNSITNAIFTDVEGKPNRLSYRGISIVERGDWDRNIKTYEDNGTTLNKPHRIILTPLSNIPLGTSDEESMSRVDSFFDQKDRTHYLDVAWKQDVKLILEDLISVAY